MTKCEVNIATTLSHTYMNIIQNIYQGTNQHGSNFPEQVHILNSIQIIFTTNHKQDSIHGDNKQTSVHIQ